jgi:hypothetical protein
MSLLKIRCVGEGSFVGEFLAKEIRGQEAATEALEQTTFKGVSFEEEVTETLHAWARAVSSSTAHSHVALARSSSPLLSRL